MLTDKTKELETQLSEVSWYKEQYMELEEKLLVVDQQGQYASSEAQVYEVGWKEGGREGGREKREGGREGKGRERGR